MSTRSWWLFPWWCLPCDLSCNNCGSSRRLALCMIQRCVAYSNTATTGHQIANHNPNSTNHWATLTEREASEVRCTRFPLGLANLNRTETYVRYLNLFRRSQV